MLSLDKFQHDANDQIDKSMINTSIIIRSKTIINKNSNDNEQQKRVKQLNQEIMMVLEKHAASFGYASAALLSVMYFISEKYTKQHPESKAMLLDYFRIEFDRFLKKLAE